MISTLINAALWSFTLVAAAPCPATGPHGTNPASSGQISFKFPLSNGFPNIKVPSDELTKVELQAHGTLPNGPLPNTLAAADKTTFELIAFNELFEVAFFTSLLYNISNSVPGFEIAESASSRNAILEALIAIQGQEQLHLLGANGILSSIGATPIQPCEYVFPSADFNSAIRFASTFTDVVLGTLQDALNNVATHNDTELVALIGSIIGQEGEQNGFYRTQLGLIPSELPFLTRSTGPFAFSVLNQNVIVKGSCPNENLIGLPIFSPLTLLTDVSSGPPADQKLQFSFQNNGTDVHSISLVYVNQQNLPLVEKLENISVNGNVITFDATFPFDQFIMNGLTFAVITNSAGPFATADEVAAATVFGPALIEIR